MTTKDFRVWMATHTYNQKTVAQLFGITEQTLSTYCKTGNFPTWFKYALKGLER